MPCHNITDIVKIKLDHNNRFVDYSLTKLNCGRAIGESSLIKNIITGRTAEQLLMLTSESILSSRFANHPDSNFLYEKHLQAIQSVLAIWLGRRDGQAGNRCAIEAIKLDEEGIALTAIIKLNLQTENIISCCQIDRNNF